MERAGKISGLGYRILTEFAHSRANWLRERAEEPVSGARARIGAPKFPPPPPSTAGDGAGWRRPPTPQFPVRTLAISASTIFRRAKFRGLSPRHFSNTVWNVAC